MNEKFEKLATQNYLLSCLPADVLQAVLRQATSVKLPAGHKLVEAGGDIEQVYFMCEGVASIIVVSKSGKMSEAGIVGSEGFVPAGALSCMDKSFTEVVMQLPGEALTIDVDGFQKLRGEYRIFEEIMNCFQHVLRTQVECTLLSNATQTVSQRLARWLLICHDRTDGNQLGLTHEFLSLMLAVRRPSVTEALHILEGYGYIWSDRARITVRNREALENYAGDIYGLPEEENNRVFDRFFSLTPELSRTGNESHVL